MSQGLWEVVIYPKPGATDDLGQPVEVERHRARSRPEANGVLHDQLLGNEHAGRVEVFDESGQKIMESDAARLRAKIEGD